MKKIKFTRSNKKWTRLVRYIRINGEILNIEEGEGIPNNSCLFENGHEVEKVDYNFYQWTCFTMLNNKDKGVLEKVTSFSLELFPNMEFASGYMNCFAFGMMELQKNDYSEIVQQFSLIFGDKVYWDIIEKVQPNNIAISIEK